MSGGQGVHTSICLLSVCQYMYSDRSQTDSEEKEVNYSLIISHISYLWSDLWTKQLATTFVLYAIMTNIL